MFSWSPAACRRLRAGCFFLALSTVLTAADAPAPWIPDLGDGSYKNPVLFADYSDPDAIRVGEDFYLTASSFTYVPGLPILRSKDLVNWSLIGYALPRLVPAERYAEPRHGEGVWAPALRYYHGKFWLYYPDPDVGIFMVTATDPAGPWSEPVLVQPGKGLIDPCPFWDDDGKLYLVHGWALSRAGVSNRLTVVPLTPDGTRFDGEARVVVDGAAIPGWRTLEGPKLYKRQGYYYIFAPAGGVKQGWQAVFRSKSIYGPYEHRIVLDQGRTAINGPHQGAWISTLSGQDWFLHFQDREAYGRIVHLQPMVWKDDWPIIGVDPDGDAKGEPVLKHAKPDTPTSPVTAPVVSDEFDGPSLGLCWQWTANPRPDWASLKAKPGSLQLTCVTEDANLYRAPNLLLQKLPAPEFEATTELALDPSAAGDQAGLIVFGFDYAWIGLRNTPDGLKLCHVVQKDALHDTAPVETIVSDWRAGEPLTLRVRVRNDAICDFAYSADGKTFTAMPASFAAQPSRWVGAKVGLFASRVAGKTATNASSPGRATVSWFRITSLSSVP